jgi:hypothetical protein
MERLRGLGRGGRILLALAVGGALFGIATAVQADIPDSGVIHGCYGKYNLHALRVIDTSKGESCLSNEIPLDWNQTGPTGPPGAPATALWAVVESTGTMIRSSGATGATHITTGQYEVDFNRDVSACAYEATLGSVLAAVGQVGVGPRFGNVNGVFVLTDNSDGSPADHGFNLAVFC